MVTNRHEDEDVCLDWDGIGEKQRHSPTALLWYRAGYSCCSIMIVVLMILQVYNIVRPFGLSPYAGFLFLWAPVGLLFCLGATFARECGMEEMAIRVAILRRVNTLESVLIDARSLPFYFTMERGAVMLFWYLFIVLAGPVLVPMGLAFSLLFGKRWIRKPF